MSRTHRLDASAAAPGADTAWLSWMRFVAICGVVAIHTCAANVVRPRALETLRGQVAIVLDLGATFAVPVFVMASGALMLDPGLFRGNAAFLRRRAGRLVPPLLFWHAWYAVLLIVVIGVDLSARELTVKTLNGNLYAALYFFWIVVGLSLLTPVLVPFVAANGRRGALVAGGVLAAIPVITTATREFREAPMVFADWALTWWLPYLGLFLLGYGLRGVVLRGPLLWLVTTAAVGLGLVNAWQWRNPDAPAWLPVLTPVGYYSLVTVLQALAVFLAFQGLIHPDGPLRALTRPAGVRLGRLLGDATLGVYGLHLTVLYLVVENGIGGRRPWTLTTHDLGIRLLVVLVVTYAIVLALRRVPYVRAVL